MYRTLLLYYCGLLLLTGLLLLAALLATDLLRLPTATYLCVLGTPKAGSAADQKRRREFGALCSEDKGFFRRVVAHGRD